MKSNSNNQLKKFLINTSHNTVSCIALTYSPFRFTAAMNKKKLNKI